MSFTSTSLLLLLLLLAVNLSPVPGFLEANYTNLKCKCHHEVKNYIPVQLIQRLQIIPAGRGCPNVEVIIWLKNNMKVCVNSNTTWFRKLIKQLRKDGIMNPKPTVIKSISFS
ncbi:C-X-C motif chemokine 13 [Tenrec ecaudatus]|uniref:C-X-C motif chemokine 13 n=1 Tax=Tenrec ecaudatus TaxID=94439 RepID=UPI003F5A3140